MHRPSAGLLIHLAVVLPVAVALPTLFGCHHLARHRQSTRTTHPQPADTGLATTVVIDPQKTIRAVPRFLFGQNIDYLNDAGGLWNARRDQPRRHALALLRSLGPALIRFPGGALANCYNWASAIGPVAHRQPQNTLWGASYRHIGGLWKIIGGQPQLPVYGFDEHMKLVSDAGAAGAIVIVNATHFSGSPQWSGSAQEAAAWVAYANSPLGGPDIRIGRDRRGINWHSSGYWARLRAANGHPVPYNVRYWEIGNEMNVDDEGAGISAAAYAARVVKYARAMRAVDPSIRIGAVMGFGVKRAWLKPLLVTAGTRIDFLIYHFYGRFYAHQQARTAFARGPEAVSLVFYNNGTLTANFPWPGGKATLAIRAYGTLAGGAWPRMKIELDGRSSGSEAIRIGTAFPLHSRPDGIGSASPLSTIHGDAIYLSTMF